jgi:hypothetical protein
VSRLPYGTSTPFNSHYAVVVTAYSLLACPN